MQLPKWLLNTKNMPDQGRSPVVEILKPTWLKEAEALEKEAERIEALFLRAYKAPGVNQIHLQPWLEKTAAMRMKAVALRVYEGKEPEQCANTTAGATATVAAKKAKKKTTKRRR